MLVVTGGAGFIGSNLIYALNNSGRTKILLVDDLTDTSKIRNISDLEIADYLDKDEFLEGVKKSGLPQGITGIFHQGACSDTMVSDGRYVMAVNYEYSKTLCHASVDAGVPFIYASSASVYGRDGPFLESGEGESPLNAYAYSKYLFDRYIRALDAGSGCQIVGLRYFNVYGPREDHKGRMASVAWHLAAQYHANQTVRLFEGSGGYEHGEQRRDFVHVADVARVNLFFLEHPEYSGIFNVGTGVSQSFNDVALATINACREVDGESAVSLEEAKRQGVLTYFSMPQALAGKYQSFTQAPISALRSIGYDHPYIDVDEGVRGYVQERYQELKQNSP